MSMEISAISAQLDQIVASATPVVSSSNSGPSTPSLPDEVAAFREAEANGQGRAFLQEHVNETNEAIRDLKLDVHFSIEVSASGGYFVRVTDQDGNEVKTIPSESFLETRERIRADIKGIIEDSKT